jgi:starch synthase
MPPRVLFLSVEVAPFAKTGGLGDVAGALPKALRALGADVRVCMPRYASIAPSHVSPEPAVASLDVPIGHRTETVALRAGSLGAGDARVPVYFVDAPKYFDRDSIYGHADDGERFLVYARAALEACRVLDWRPDVVHCNDWHTGIVPNWLETLYRDDHFFRDTASVFTIHNLAYQGLFDWHFLELAGLQAQGFLYPQISELQHTVDLMGRGIFFADAVTTVSERYAEEILIPEYGERLDPLLRERRDRLFGILNGIDEIELDPRTDPHLAAHFGVASLDGRLANTAALRREALLPELPRAPLIGMVGRLSGQKGLDILLPAIDALLRLPAQLVVLGTGDEHYHQALREAQQRHPDRCAVFLTFDTPLAQRIYGGCDAFLMPSRYEPCGLGQLIAMRYGAVPIVRATGGLADTVRDYDPSTTDGTGFTFDVYDHRDLLVAATRAVETFRRPPEWRLLQQRGMRQDFSWRRSAEKYLAVYEKALSFAR